MTQIIFQRSIVAFILFLSFILGVKGWTAFYRWRVRSRSLKKRLSFALAPGTPVLLYFWTSACSQCKPQERQIERARTVLQQFGKTLNIQKLNALDEQVLAKHMHVMTVPTTVLLNSEGTVARWNPGLTHADIIIKQYLAPP